MGPVTNPTPERRNPPAVEVAAEAHGQRCTHSVVVVAAGPESRVFASCRSGEARGRQAPSRGPNGALRLQARDDGSSNRKEVSIGDDRVKR